MAVAIVGGGSASGGTTSISPTVTATVNAGDLLILVVVSKYPANPPSTPSGWTFRGSDSGGPAASGVDGGKVLVSIYTREADGTEDGSTVTVTITGGNSAIGRIFRATHSGGQTGIHFLSGQQNTVTVNWSTVLAPTTELHEGDVILTVAGINTDGKSWSAQSLTGSGVTITLGTERSDAGTAQGDDCGYNVIDWSVAVTGGGAASPSLTYAATGSGGASSSEPAGAICGIIIREVFVAAGTGEVGGVTADGTAEQHFVATGTGSVSGVTADGTAEQHFVASGTGSVSGVTADGTAEQQFAASGTGTVSGVAADAVAEQVFVATGTGTVGGITASGTAEQCFVATGTGSVSGVTADGTAEQQFIASGAGTVNGVTADGTAEQVFVASGSGSAGGVTADGTAEQRFVAAGAGTISGVTAEGTAELVFIAGGTGEIGALVGDGTAVLEGVVSQPPTEELDAEYLGTIGLEACYDGEVELIAEYRTPELEAGADEEIELAAEYVGVIELEGSSG